jgi:phospholipase D1/2
MNAMREFEFRETQAPEVLLTAAEAFPAFERAVLSARREVWGSFRIFDLDTRLRSSEARLIGETWFDLMVHTLKRGVRVRVVLTDFDPVVRPRLHALTWRSVRQFSGAREIAGPRADLDIVPSLHSARTRLLPRLAVAPLALWTLRKGCRWLTGLTPDQRAAMLRDLPGLARYVKVLGDGSVAPRYLSVPELFPATHHQKLAVIDRRKLYIGGIDLNERRYDTPAHDRPGRETWQDVQMMLEGEVAEEAQAHLESFLSSVDGRSDPPPTRQLLRTLSRRRRRSRVQFGPKPVLRQILDRHRLLIRRSRRLIYLETQFLRDRSVTRALVDAARANPDLGLILILPAAPEEVAFSASDDLDFRYGEFLQARCLRKVRGAFGTRAFIGTAAQPRPAARRYSGSSRDRLRGAEIVYIHSKVSIFDDTAAIVSSANLNGRSLHWDTEAGVILSAQADVAALRRKVFAHWLPEDAGEAFFDSRSAVASWRRLAIRNARREPAEREGFVMPYDLKAAEAFGVNLPAIPEEMV